MCYDNTNHKVVEREGCISKVIRGSRKSIAKPNIETRVRTSTKKHRREGTKAHNS